MAGFKAEKAVERLDYDMGPTALYEGRRIEGITPDPSDEQMAVWGQQTAQLAREFNADRDGIDINDRMAVLEWMADQPPSRAMELEKRTAKLHADVCSNKPSFEEIMATPPRIRSAWYRWLSGELNPEGSTPDTKA